MMYLPLYHTIGGFHAKYNGEMNKCWWTNKASWWAIFCLRSTSMAARRNVKVLISAHKGSYSLSQNCWDTFVFCVSLSRQCWCTRFGDWTAILNNFERDKGSTRRKKTAFGLSDPTIFVWGCAREEFERVLTDTEVNLQVGHKRRAFALLGRPLCFANVSIAVNWVILA